MQVLGGGIGHFTFEQNMKRDIRDGHQRLSSAFDLLLIFLRSLILTPPPNNAYLEGALEVHWVQFTHWYRPSKNT